MKHASDGPAAAHPPAAVLEEIERRVLWLAVRMVDAANRERDAADGVKVGGHQASSASLVSVMTALWFVYLDAEDRVAVKPHAAPTFHAIQYLLGRLDRSYLTALRAWGGLQAYPSRTKDPDPVDFSTGSVGLGAAAPLFAAVTRRYVDDHFGPRPAARFVSLIGDAELDEGNIWEAVAEPATAGLGSVLWIVDFNRQSLDRVVPGVRISQWSTQFRAAGWHVEEVKYGRKLQAQFGRPGGQELRAWIDAMPNEHYQSLFGLHPTVMRERFLEGAPEWVRAPIDAVPDDDLAALLTDLGGHDLEQLVDVLARCDAVTDRPSVVFAYTVKGWGLPIAGNPRNHSAMLTGEQIATLRADVGLTPDDEWDRIAPDTPAGAWCEVRGAHLVPAPRPLPKVAEVPSAAGIPASRAVSSQETFGRILTSLSRHEGVADFLVTTAPDVATSTNLAGFINRNGVYAPEQRRAWDDDPVLRWVEGPSGRHIELGISEMNLFLLLGQLGLSWDLSVQPLLPVGTVYDPFVCRGLDALIYAAYSGARFVVAGTPSGVTLAPEGGAHQSTITASIGVELPGLTVIEPAYAVALDWLVCDALRRVADPDAPSDEHGDSAFYFRLSTRPIDQEPFERARVRGGDDVLRGQVLAGAYRLVDASWSHTDPVVTLVASGAVVPEVVRAAEMLASEGAPADVVEVTALGRLYASWRRSLREGIRSGRVPERPSTMETVFRAGTPLVTVHDAASHAMAWIGSALGATGVPLGVDAFGQSGTVADLYAAHDLSAESIVNAALAAIALADGRS